VPNYAALLALTNPQVNALLAFHNAAVGGLNPVQRRDLLCVHLGIRV
jgi:hypothetical protein